MPDHNQKALPLEPYMQRRSSLEQTLHDQARSFDKAILTLSSGSIALSITYVEKIAQHPVGWTKVCLAIAWVLFGTAILSTLLSFLTSQAVHKALIESWDQTFERQCDPEGNGSDEIYDNWTKRLNVFSVVSFVGAVAFFVAFAIGNL